MLIITYICCLVSFIFTSPKPKKISFVDVQKYCFTGVTWSRMREKTLVSRVML